MTEEHRQIRFVEPATERTHPGISSRHLSNECPSDAGWPTGRVTPQAADGASCRVPAGFWLAESLPRQEPFYKRAELLHRFAARREEACGLSDVDVRNEQPSLAVGLVAEQRPVGPHDC